MPEFLAGILIYLILLSTFIVATLTLTPNVPELVEQDPSSNIIVIGIVFLAGVSTLLGESSVLFVNRVRRSRFVISLITNGLVFLISYFVWGLMIYLVARILYAVEPSLGSFTRMVGLSTAPLVFGFLVLVPWMGPFIGKILSIWSLLILVIVVEYEFKLSFWPAAFTVGLGWVVSLAFTNTIGRPVVALRNKVFQMVSGSRLDVDAEDILLSFAGANFANLPADTEAQEELAAEQRTLVPGNAAESPAANTGTQQ